MDIVDKEFRENFDNWVREQLEEQYHIELDKHRDYFYYITQVSPNPEEGLKIFFALCEGFFEEVHKRGT